MGNLIHGNEQTLATKRYRCTHAPKTEMRQILRDAGIDSRRLKLAYDRDSTYAKFARQGVGFVKSGKPLCLMSTSHSTRRILPTTSMYTYVGTTFIFLISSIWVQSTVKGSSRRRRVQKGGQICWRRTGYVELNLLGNYPQIPSFARHS